jgi:hypothetical protein
VSFCSTLDWYLWCILLLRLLPSLNNIFKFTVYHQEHFKYHSILTPSKPHDIPIYFFFHLHRHLEYSLAQQYNLYGSDQFFSRGRLLTEKLMLQGFLHYRLMSALRKFYGRYNDLIYDYKLLLSHMLSGIFHTNN